MTQGALLSYTQHRCNFCNIENPSTLILYVPMGMRSKVKAAGRYSLAYFLSCTQSEVKTVCLQDTGQLAEVHTHISKFACDFIL